MIRSWAYNRFGVLMGTSSRASCPRWPSLRGNSWPMITLFSSQGDFCATAFIHICTYRVDRLTYALRYTTEKCFDCGFLTVRQHAQNDRLCLHTSCDDGHKITVTFFQRYLVETNHL